MFRALALLIWCSGFNILDFTDSDLVLQHSVFCCSRFYCMPSIWANFNQELEMFQDLFSTFLLWPKNDLQFYNFAIDCTRDFTAKRSIYFGSKKVWFPRVWWRKPIFVQNVHKCESLVSRSKYFGQNIRFFEHNFKFLDQIMKIFKNLWQIASIIWDPK